jgi:hypothetical protein
VPWDDEPEPVTQAVPVVRAEPATHADPLVPADDSVTKPMRSRPEHLLHAPAEAWHSDPIESWRHFPREDEPEEPVPARDPEPQSDSSRGILDELLSDALRPKSKPIGFVHNGFHVDEEERFQPLPPPAPDENRPSRHERSAPHHLAENQPEKRQFWFESKGRHSRDDDPDHAPRYGRHSLPGRD